jgi:hypothetical protein
MFFSRKPTDFILVERDRLLLYPKGKVPLLPLSEDVIQYLEVKDGARLQAAVADFAAKNNLRGRRVLLMLDKSIVFQKAILLAKNLDPLAVKADFESRVPFNPEDRQVLSMQQKDRQFLFGVNSAFYHLLMQAIVQAGAKVTAVTPAIIYGITDTSKVNPAKLTQVAQATALTQSANLLAGP